MNNPREVLLDIDGVNYPPSGYVIIDNPVGLIEHSLESEPLFVKGKSLCRWAENLAVGRGWHTTRLESPIHELMECCPTLSKDMAVAIIDQLGETLVSLPRPLRLVDVLENLYGETGLWIEEPEIEHAFQWLCWVAQQEKTGPKFELVWHMAQNWQVQADLPLKPAYSARSEGEAWSLLKEWLKVCDSKYQWPDLHQLTLTPSLLSRLKQDFMMQAIETNTDFFRTVLTHNPDKAYLKIAAQTCAEVMLKHPEKATSERINLLKRYLPHDSEIKLRDLISPQDPELPKWNFSQLEAWFTEKYLPYRELVSRRGTIANDPEWVVRSARQFALQYLDYYISARVGGDGADKLAWAKSAHLRNLGGGFVYVLVVLDGLTYPDATRLRDYIESNTKRLSLDRQSLALGPLPTVTEFAKPSVCRGMLPVEATSENNATACASIEEVSQTLLTAVPGDVIVWAHIEPDRTYHFRADKGLESVRGEVDAQLLTIANQIASLAEKAPAKQNLRIIVTTDHGRLLVNSKRTRDIPQGMKAHGRAAWGEYDVKFQKSGYFVDEDLVYLDPSRFGLPLGQVYAVITSDEAFKITDGRKGNEPFPHGGLFPEEVLIPWLEFTRDRVPLLVKATLRGEGEEGKVGKGILIVTNSNYTPITLVDLVVEATGMHVAINKEVGDLQESSLEVTLPEWPSKQDLEGLMMCLIYELPDGQRFRHEFKPELKTESIYERPDILGEFGGL